MVYMGSKRRIAAEILPIMLQHAEHFGVNTWVEPFVGGANMLDKVPPHFNRIGCDINPHTIAALKDIRDRAHELPDSLSEAEYKALRGLPAGPTTSWLRFVASFGGKFENGYAREKGSTPLTFPEKRKRNALEQAPLLYATELAAVPYTDLSYIKNALIYCDPPYEGTTGYKVGAFDHGAFWKWCRQMAKDNLVFVSEYNAPPDFIAIWQGKLLTQFSYKAEDKKATEKLFTII